MKAVHIATVLRLEVHRIILLIVAIAILALLPAVILVVEVVRVRQLVEEHVRLAEVHAVVEDKELTYSTNKNYQYI